MEAEAWVRLGQGSGAAHDHQARPGLEGKQDADVEELLAEVDQVMPPRH